jgi:hypothetical protein
MARGRAKGTTGTVGILLTDSLDGPIGLLDDRSATSGNPVGHDRVSGGLAGLEGADAQVEIVQAGEFGEPAGRFGAELLLDLDEPPTSIICISDLVAYGVVQVAAERGLTVPDDLSVVGFDGTHLAARMNPALTTVRQDVEAKGREAARALVRSLEVGRRRDRACGCRHRRSDASPEPSPALSVSWVVVPRMVSTRKISALPSGLSPVRSTPGPSARRNMKAAMAWRVTRAAGW